MILIRKSNHELEVSKETYENMFKELGYEIVDKNKKSKKNNKEEIKKEQDVKNIKETEKKEETELDKFLEDVCEKDIEPEDKEKKVNDILSVMSSKKEEKK